MPALPAAFLTRPIAHRALHDVTDGRPENSRAAVQAAIDHGYGIEIDLQLSADGQAMVYHDYDLDRLTGETGRLRDRSAAELARFSLKHGAEGIPTLADVLDLVAGRVPVLIEIKDQDGALGPDIGLLEDATLAALDSYPGDVAIMSFNPHSVARIAAQRPDLPVGLTTCAFLKQDWTSIPDARLVELRCIPDFARTNSSFVSHNAADLAAPRLRELLKSGANVLCWTIQSPQAEAQARKFAQNVTFEGYLA